MQLSELGFPAHRIQQALKATESQSLEAALDWLQNEQDKSALYEHPIDVDALPVDEASSSKSSKTANIVKDEEAPKPKSLEEIKEKVAEKRKLEDQQREEEERARELQRRQEGKDLLALKRQRDEAQRRQMMEEQRKQREDEERRRQKVLAQIAEDRRRNMESKAEEDVAIVEKEASPEKKPRVQEADDGKTRIQIRGLSGGPFKFEPLATFQDVLKAIEARAPGTMHRHRLILALPPPREFTAADATKTLVDLGLAPSCVLTLAPLRK